MGTTQKETPIEICCGPADRGPVLSRPSGEPANALKVVQSSKVTERGSKVTRSFVALGSDTSSARGVMERCGAEVSGVERSETRRNRVEMYLELGLYDMSFTNLVD